MGEAALGNSKLVPNGWVHGLIADLMVTDLMGI